MRDPYSVLGVKRDAGADEIKAAWRTAAKSSHPDQNRDDPDATKRFAEIGRAYEVLKDPEKRSRYDVQRTKAEARKREQTIQQQREAAREAAERARMAKANAEKVMAELARAEAEKAKADKADKATMAAAQAGHAARAGDAGQARPAGEKPAGPQAAAQPQAKPVGGKAASPEEVVSRIFGDTPEATAAAETLRRESEAQNVESEDSDAPPKPAASLLDPIELLSALLRRIRGKQPVSEKAPDLFIEASVTIEDLLKGNWVSVSLPEGRQVRFVLEGGLTDGHLVRLKNQGLKIPGMQRGDVVVTLKVAKTSGFTVDGFDIHTILPVTLENAVLGCVTKVEAPEGPVDITIPSWSGSDQSIRMDGLGLPDGEGGRGALVVELRVLLWEKPDDKVTDLMRVMREGLYL